MYFITVKKQHGNVGVPALHDVNACFHTSPVHLQVHSSEVESQEELISSPGRASLQPKSFLSIYITSDLFLASLTLQFIYVSQGDHGSSSMSTKYYFPNFSSVLTAIRAIPIKLFLHGPSLEGNLLSFIDTHVSKNNSLLFSLN